MLDRLRPEKSLLVTSDIIGFKILYHYQRINPMHKRASTYIMMKIFLMNKNV